MEHNAANVVGVPFEGIHFPVLIATKSPELDGLVVCRRSEDFHSWVEADPVDSFLVTFEDMFDFNFGASVKLIRLGPCFGHTLLLQLVKVPDSDRLVKTAARYQGVLRVESCRHNIMRMACQNCDTTSVLPVPDSHGLIVTAAHNPRQLQVKLNCAHVVQMSSQGKHALFYFVVPYFD